MFGQGVRDEILIEEYPAATLFPELLIEQGDKFFPQRRGAGARFTGNCDERLEYRGVRLGLCSGLRSLQARLKW